MLKTASNYINAIGALNYKGTWDAATNTPTLTSGVGNKGDYYVVSVAGSTNLDGITSWVIGDWAAFNGAVWQKIDNTDSVTSVNGQTGTVVLIAPDVGATPNTTYVLAGTGISGGGQLNANVTVNLANTTVVANTYGNASSVGVFTADAQGRLTSASNTAIAISVGAVSGAVPNTVNILTSGLASGGGALTGNVTITVNDIPVANVTGAVPNTRSVNTSGLLSGGGNLSTDLTISLTSVPAANVTGLGTMATQNANAVVITGGTINSTSQLSGTYTNVNVTSVAVTFPNSYLANSTATLGNATITLGGTTTSVGNLTLANVTISSGSVTANVTSANVNLTGTTTANATFATSSLPLVPEGYITVQIAGVNKKIPYYGV
jgi:fructose-specific component phosphotransferase system IIB-like protein